MLASDPTSDSFETPADGTGDLALVDACRDGDQKAWHALYSSHFELAFRTARRLGASSTDAEDIVAESFEVVFRKLDDFKHGRFSFWLYRVVLNVTAARMRKARVRTFFHSMLGSSGGGTLDSHEASVDAKRQLERAQAVLLSLSSAKREVFTLHELEGLTHEQIATIIGEKAATVRSRLHYAKRDFEKLAKNRGLLP